MKRLVLFLLILCIAAAVILTLYAQREKGNVELLLSPGPTLTPALAPEAVGMTEMLHMLPVETDII